MVENGDGLLPDRSTRCAGSTTTTSATPTDGADPRVSPLRAPESRGPPARVRDHRRVRPAARPGHGLRRSGLRDAGVPVDARVYDGMFHGFFGMQDAIDVAREGAFDDAGRGAPRRVRDLRRSTGWPSSTSPGSSPTSRTTRSSTASTCTTSATSSRATRCARTGRSTCTPRRGARVRVDLYLSLEVDPRVLLGFEDAVIGRPDGRRPARRVLLPAQLHVGAPAAAAGSRPARARHRARRRSAVPTCRSRCRRSTRIPSATDAPETSAARSSPTSGCRCCASATATRCRARLLDRCLVVSRYLLDQAPDWIG